MDLVGPSTGLLDVPFMADELALELLKAKLPANKLDQIAGAELVRMLGGIPLAISHAAAYIDRRCHMSIQDYMGLLGKIEESMKQILGDERMSDLRRDAGAATSVISAIYVSVAQLEKESIVEALMISIVSVLDRNAIPLAIILSKELSEDSADEISTLVNYSLVTHNTKDAMLHVHWLVQFAVRAWLDMEGMLSMIRRLSILYIWRERARPKMENWPFWEALLPHARLVTRYKCKDPELSFRQSEILATMSEYARNRSEFSLAETLLNEARASEERYKPSRNPDLKFADQRDLAAIYWCQDRRTEALEELVQATEQAQTVLGDEAPVTLDLMLTLGLVLELDGQYKDAEQLLLRVLKHVDDYDVEIVREFMAKVLNQLTLLYRKQGRWNEAEELDRRFTPKFKQALYAKHPSLSNTHRLALMWKERGDFEEAETLLLQALEKAKQVLGNDYAQTRKIMSELLMLYGEQRKWEDARKMAEILLESATRACGDENPEAFASMHVICLTYLNEGRLKDAEKANLHSVDACKRAVGNEHNPRVLTAKIGLAAIYWDQNTLSEHQELIDEIIADAQHIVPGDSEADLQCINSVGQLLKFQGRTSEAEKMFDRAMEGRKRKLGPEHPKTLESMCCLAETKKTLGQIEEGIKLMQEVAVKRAKIQDERYLEAKSAENHFELWYHEFKPKKLKQDGAKQAHSESEVSKPKKKKKRKNKGS